MHNNNMPPSFVCLSGNYHRIMAQDQIFRRVRESRLFGAEILLFYILRPIAGGSRNGDSSPLTGAVISNRKRRPRLVGFGRAGVSAHLIAREREKLIVFSFMFFYSLMIRGETYKSNDPSCFCCCCCL